MISTVNFDEAKTYLLSLGNEVSAMKLGLENIRALLDALGNPQHNYLKVQVAGTNGKGSVCAFLGSICMAAGIKAGVYTSPHLVSITERVKINGVNISEDVFATLATRVCTTSERLIESGGLDSIPTFFEQITAIALLAFAEARVELAILETGLGGRLDATTAANAEIAAITRIDLDHQEYLGETIEEIAAEKAAIIHEGSRVVVGEQQQVSMDIILERCRAAGVTAVLATTGRKPTSREPLGLVGRHQAENAKVAVAVAKVLHEHLPITDEDILAGLETATHPGRLEQVGQFLLDGAHNVGGARALREYLDEFVQQPITMIFGSMQDKDVKGILTILFPKAEKLILTRPDNSRALGPDDLLKILSVELDRERVFVTQNASEAIAKAHEISGEDSLIVVTGSLYLVGEAKKLMQHSAPPPRSEI